MTGPSDSAGRPAIRFTVTPPGLAPRWLVDALARRLRRAARRLGLDPAAQAGVAIHLVDDAAIARLNATHMGKSGPTDVLSFPALDGPVAPRDVEPDEGDAPDDEQDDLDVPDEPDAPHEQDTPDDDRAAPDAAPGAAGLGDVVISVGAVRRQARARVGLADMSPAPGRKRQVLWGVVVETGRIEHALPDLVRGTAESAAAIDEATVLAVHGLCHLLGHDHARPAEARAMHRRERRGLKAARTPDVPRPYVRTTRR